MRRYVIIGAGGFAREVLDIFEACNDAGLDYEVLGYLVEATYSNPGEIVNDKPVVGDLDWLSQRAAEVEVICGVGDPRVRRRLVDRVRSYRARFGNCIHPTAVLTRRISMGDGVVVAAGCILTNGIRIGNHVHVNLACTIGHDAVLNDFSTLAPGVHVSGRVTLGEGCYIGSGANIIEGLSIGAWSVVGAGSVVIDDVPQYSTVVGVPARVIKSGKG